MASTLNASLCAVLALMLWTSAGLPIAMRMAPRWSVLLAPVLGWAIHSALALPVLSFLGMSRLSVAAVFIVASASGLLASWSSRSGDKGVLSAPVAVAVLAAAVLAVGVMAAVLPKVSADGVALASPIFDHTKIAMIDEMARAGVPPVNPFFGGAGTPPRLSYYYLWHFSAAELAVLAGASGWEADAGLTWFTAFAGLTAMMALAVTASQRASAALWVVAIAATGSMRPLLYALFNGETVGEITGYPSGLGGWLFQTSWAPQHAMSAICAVLAVGLLVQSMQRPRTLTLAALSLTMTAAFESSTWIGGIFFPLAAAAIALVMLWHTAPAQRLRVVTGVALAVALALLLISPMVYDQLHMATSRGGGAPVIFEPQAILDDAITDRIGDLFGVWAGQVADVAAYWLIYLPVELPASYLAGLAALIYALTNRSFASRRTEVITAAIAIVISLAVSGNLVSTLGENNDLGWRSLLPAAILLIVCAAAGLSRLAARPFAPFFIAAVALIVAGVPAGVHILSDDIVAQSAPASKSFAAAPAVWQAVRRVTGRDERVANNPEADAAMTPWSANLPWALLANRRSCFAGLALVGPLTALSSDESHRIATQVARVFAGNAEADDVGDLAKRYDCKTAVLTPEDGAWANDPFAKSPFYRRVDETAGWRIYRAAD